MSIKARGQRQRPILPTAQRQKMTLLPNMALVLAALCACMLPVYTHAVVRAASCVPGTYSCAEECRQVQFCLSSHEQVTVDTCAEGWTCDATAHACVEGGVCVTPPDPDVFLCHDFGYFPNPFDCTKYYLCLNDQGEQAEQAANCTGRTAYDPLSARCSLTLTSRPCVEGPVPTCTAPGQVGPQQENPNIYFVCVRTEKGAIAPALYKCPSNEIFVGNKCVVDTRGRPKV